MASSSPPIECGICLEGYNTARRPRTLPCAHNFCGPCLQSCINKGNNKCSVCRRTYTAPTLDDIPINSDLEKLIQMWSFIAVDTNKTKDSNESDLDFPFGRCSTHIKSYLYFKCKTHDINICRECAVIEHSPSNCIIIEIKEEHMIAKENTLKEAQQKIDYLDSETSSLDKIIIEKNESINNKKIEIECLFMGIDEDSKVRDQAQKEIEETNTTITLLLDLREKLRAVFTSKQIGTECQQLQNTLDNLGNLHNELTEDYDTAYYTKLLLKDPKHATKIILYKMLREGIYAVEGEQIIRSSKIFPVNGKLQVSSLERVVRPTSNATIIPVSSLLVAAGAQPVVYLGLQAEDRPLGRIRIRLTCGPRRREQMLRLCTAQGGAAWKGSWFDLAEWVGRPGERVMCWRYTTPEGDRSDTPIVQDLEPYECERRVEGAFTGYMGAAGFMICTRADPSRSAEGPELGRVLSGLDMLRYALKQYGRDVSQIRIAEAGVEISP